MESEYNYKEVWNYAMEQISQQYKELGQESEFKLWFNIEYIEDTIDTIKVSAPSEFMWNRMVEKGNIAKICDKIKGGAQAPGRSAALLPHYPSAFLGHTGSHTQEARRVGIRSLGCLPISVCLLKVRRPG